MMHFIIASTVLPTAFIELAPFYNYLAVSIRDP